MVPVMCAIAVGSSSAEAGEAPITVGEITPPPPNAGLDSAAIRDTAEGEVRSLDASRIPSRRKVVVALTLVRAGTDDAVAAWTVNAMVRDARTGNMIGIIEAGARSEGPASSEVKRQVAHAAVRRAIRRVPRVLLAD